MNNTTRKRIAIAAALIAVAVLIVLFYSAFDPIATRWMPQCAFHSLTGLSCPGCGMQRALHAALNCDITGALAQNLFLILSIPYLFFVIWGTLKFLPASGAVARIACHRYAAIAYIILFFVWWILRNILGI